MKRFEYLVVSVEKNSDESMKSLGNEGWELVTIFNRLMYFKRELNQHV
jgi:hypothetical protein